MAVAKKIQSNAFVEFYRTLCRSILHEVYVLFRSYIPEERLLSQRYKEINRLERAREADRRAASVREAALLRCIDEARSMVNRALRAEQAAIIRVQTLEPLAMRHPITELLNGNGVADAWLRLASNLKREQEKNTHVLFIDVDRLKSINDKYGHAIGDEALKLVALKMKSAFRKGDLLGHIHGDEFIVIMSHAPKEIALQRADLLKELLDAESKKNAWGVSVSIGIVKVSPDENWEAAKARADVAMYQSKARGRNTVTYTG